MNNAKTFLLIVSAFFAGSVVSLTTTLALAHGGDTNLNHGCVNNLTGALKIIAAGASCGAGETALDWNAKDLPGTGVFVNLSGIDFFNGETGSSADFRYRSFIGADLSNSNFYDALFAGADLRGTNFSNTGLDGAQFDGRDGQDDLTTTNFMNADIGNATFRSINLTGKDFTNVDRVQGTKFISSNLTNVDLSGLDFTGGSGSFEHSILAGTDFTGVNVANTSFSGVTGSGTDFTNADLTGADFTGHSLTSSVWSNTTCPDGSNSDSHSNTCVGYGL